MAKRSRGALLGLKSKRKGYLEETTTRGTVASEGGMEPAPRVPVEREPVAKVNFAGNWNSPRQVQGPVK